MAAHIDQPTRSRRFVKLYLSTWALLASGALAYLAVLAFPPNIDAPAPSVSVRPAKATSTEVTEVKVRQVKTAEVKALAEMQGSISEIRKDVSQLQEAVGERVINEKAVETRLTSLEDRVSTIDSRPESPSATPVTKVPGITLLPAGEPRPSVEPPFKSIDEPSATALAPAQGAPHEGASIETGSIPPKAEIVFGEPVVTRGGAPEMAVQLAAGPSLQAVRQSWELLSERYGGTLATLQPRVVAPRGEGGVYRLLAGPLPTKADAQRICSQLGVGRKACFATRYAGVPLPPPGSNP
jgi:TolA-binding protein